MRQAHRQDHGRMSIAAKHAYRFGFLKSEKWSNVRLACLARDKGCCMGCGKFDLSNDAHHIEYPENWYDTKLHQLRTLCRECHERVHEIMEVNPEMGWKLIKAKVNIERNPEYTQGKDQFLLFSPVVLWRRNITLLCIIQSAKYFPNVKNMLTALRM